MFDIFLNKETIKPITILQYDKIFKFHIKTKNASILWINFPKVIALVCKYKGILEPEDMEIGNINKSEAITDNISIPDKIIAVYDYLLNCL